jgi:hypothetical protein
MTSEQKILTIGIVTIVGWTIYSRNKEAKERLKKQATTPPVDSNAVGVVPRRAIRQQYKVVMPSDLVSNRVRQRASELTAGRFSVDMDKLV